MAEHDTIVASSTGYGDAGIGIIRLSGSNCANIAKSICKKNSFKERLATNSSFYSSDGVEFDSGLTIFFGMPKSYTGEDVVEFHCHGGQLVQKILLERCIELGARPAHPGEFTKRAYLNGKIDLLQAENVQNIIRASSLKALTSANKALSGAPSKTLRIVREKLILLMSEIEAQIDFPEEGIDTLNNTSLLRNLEALRDELKMFHRSMQKGHLIKNGLKLVICGKPNVGKSTIFNALVGEDAAIVTDLAGTTRDVIRGSLDVKGLNLQIADTAGIRDAVSSVEKIGVARARAEIAGADIIMYVTDSLKGLTDFGMDVMELPDKIKKIIVLNKIDRLNEPPLVEKLKSTVRVNISAKDEPEMNLLREAIEHLIGNFDVGGALMASGRQVDALTKGLEHIGIATQKVFDIEIFAEEIRLAAKNLAEVTGDIPNEEILGEIFANFCIGK